MPNPSTETQIALLILRQKEVENDIADVRAESRAAIAALQDERTKALKWGVMSLGTAVMGMAYWIFDAITKGHFK